MKKLALVTTALALLGGASTVGAANHEAKSAKNHSTKPAFPRQGAADKAAAAEVAAKKASAEETTKVCILWMIRASAWGGMVRRSALC